MSVAAATTSEAKVGTVNLWTASMKGGLYVIAALAVVFAGIPHLWEVGVAPWMISGLNKAFNLFFFVVAEVGAVILLTMFGLNLAGPHPVKGLRGGIFLSILTIFTGLFLLRWVLSTVERMSKNFEIGQFLSLAVVGFCIYLFWKYLKSDRMTRWAVKLEEAGWFDAKSYKRNQGIRVRRATIMGLLLLFGSGIYTMLHNRVIGDTNWVVSIPFAETNVTLLPHLQYTVPVILGLLAIWFAWRIVNFPVFADFLIATEAEMNKVSWTPRARPHSRHHRGIGHCADHHHLPVFRGLVLGLVPEPEDHQRAAQRRGSSEQSVEAGEHERMVNRPKAVFARVRRRD